MGENRFQEGQEVKCIWFADTEGGRIRAGEGNTEKITVIMEKGQMDFMPWFAVWEDGKIESKWNGTYIAGVEL